MQLAPGQDGRCGVGRQVVHDQVDALVFGVSASDVFEEVQHHRGVFLALLMHP